MKIQLLSTIFHHSNKAIIIDATSYSLHQKHSVLKYTASQEIERIQSLVSWLKSRTARDWILASTLTVSLVAFILIGLTTAFLLPRNHSYSFSEDNCFFNPIALPNTVSSVGSNDYVTTIQPTISVGKTPLFSANTCLEIAKIPEPESNHIVKLKSPLPIQKNVSLTTKSLPILTAIDDLARPVSPDAVLLFNSDQKDTTFNYKLKISDKTTDCVVNSKLVACPLAGQNLDQGQKYTYEMFRVLGNDSSIIVNNTFATLDPVVINDSDIQQNEVIYSILSEFILTSNKPIKNLSGLSLKSEDGETAYPISEKITDSTIAIKLLDNLPRNTTFKLNIDSIESIDGAYLSEPYSLTFKTSAGPQLQNISIPSYKVSPSSAITLTFDIELDENQPLEKSISITNNSGLIPSRISVQNNIVTIRPINNLPGCSSFTVSVTNELKNKFGVYGSSLWSTTARTTCQQVFSIGNSVQGRSITAYKFGSGATKILYVGGMHGDEKSSVSTLTSFVDDLERNYTNIPANKTIIVIPNTNPDGFVASTRTNANNVDLNRNFPTFDWTSGVYMPRNVYLEMGGGATPLSEPESSVLANYTSGLSPRVVLTFHATGRAVFANDAGDSKAIADIYADKSGFTSYSDADASSFFSYPTTGEYEDWIRDKLNLPALLVELAGVSNNEYTRQKPALWAMLNL
jgi:murein peptide amidase A